MNLISIRFKQKAFTYTPVLKKIDRLRMRLYLQLKKKSTQNKNVKLWTHRKLKFLQSFEKVYNFIESLLSWNPFKKNFKKKTWAHYFLQKITQLLKNVISFFSGNECLFEKHAVDFLNLPFFNGSSNFTKIKTFQKKIKKHKKCPPGGQGGSPNFLRG